MKPTGATKEATAATLSRPLPWSMNWTGNHSQISDANDVPIGQLYDFDATAYMLIAVNERERLREIARLADALIVKLYDKHLVPYLMQYEVDILRSRIRAALREADKDKEAKDEGLGS